MKIEILKRVSVARITTPNLLDLYSRSGIFGITRSMKLEKIKTAVNRLQDFSESGNILRYSILKKQGYRVIIVERHLVFYKFNMEEKTVII